MVVSSIRLLSIICLVFLTLYSTANCEESGSFNKPTRNTDERIVDLQQKLLNVQSQILALKVSMENDGNSDVLKGRLTALEQTFQQLKEQMDAEHRASAAHDAKYDHALTTLMGYLNKLDAELKELKNKANPTNDPSDWERVGKVVKCIATVLPIPFSIFGSIPCILNEVV